MHANKLLWALLMLVLFININISNQTKAQNTVIKANPQQLTKNPNSENILALLRTNLDTKTTKKGDSFAAVLMDDITAGQKVIIPKNSIISGQVLKVLQPMLPSRDAAIVFGINQIQTPQGQVINVAGKGTKFKIQSPYAQTIRSRVAKRAPVTIASTGTSIPLDYATNINGGIIYAITTGVSIVTGFATGIFTPEYGQNRMQAAFSRAYESSPIGGLQIAATKGKDLNLKSGDPIILTFNKDLLAILNNTANNITNPTKQANLN